MDLYINKLYGETMLDTNDLLQIENLIDTKLESGLKPIKATLKKHEIILQLHGERLASLEEKVDKLSDNTELIKATLIRMEISTQFFLTCTK